MWVHVVGGEWVVRVCGVGLRRGYSESSPLVDAIREGLSWCILCGLGGSIEVRGSELGIPLDCIEPHLRVCGVVTFVECPPPSDVVYF